MNKKRIKKAIQFFLTCEDKEITPARARKFADLVWEEMRCSNCKDKMVESNHWCPECQETLPDPLSKGKRSLEEMQARLKEPRPDKNGQKKMFLSETAPSN